MSDPNEIVACKAKDGSILYRRRHSAESWGLTILDRPATDGHGRPLPDKPKTRISEPTKPGPSRTVEKIQED